MRHEDVTARYNPELHDAISRAGIDDLDPDYGTIPFITGSCADLEVGEIDSEAITCFMHGNCGPLALALHDLTGWDLVLLHGTDAAIFSEPERTWLHVLVRHPDGNLVDIQGHHSEDAMADEWLGRGEIYFTTATARQVTELVFDEDGWDNYTELEAALIRDFARVVLRQIGEGSLLSA